MKDFVHEDINFKIFHFQCSKPPEKQTISREITDRARKLLQRFDIKQIIFNRVSYYILPYYAQCLLAFLPKCTGKIVVRCICILFSIPCVADLLQSFPKARLGKVREEAIDQLSFSPVLTRDNQIL